MKNQSGTIKTNLELDRVVIGGSGGYRRLPGGSDDFSLQTDKQTLHHNIYITIILRKTTQSSWWILAGVGGVLLLFPRPHLLLRLLHQPGRSHNRPSHLRILQVGPH